MTPSQTLDQTAHPLPPPTPPTLPQPKHRHISHFPHVLPGLVKPKPNPLTQSPQHLPPDPSKHIHMSHTPHTPLTTLISITSPALDKHLNHVYHPYAHSPQAHFPRYTSPSTPTQISTNHKTTHCNRMG